MAETVESRLKTLGIVLPAPAKPAANYVPVVRTGNLLFISGQVSFAPGGQQFTGKVGSERTIEEGQSAARICAINLLGALKATIGDFEKLVRFVKLTGFVNCTPEFQDVHKVINGCSDLLTEVLGIRGKHARSAVGMASLPLGASVEVEAIVEVVS